VARAADSRGLVVVGRTQTPLKLGLVKVLGLKPARGNGFKPPADQIGGRGIGRLQPNQIHRFRAEFVWRVAEGRR